MSIAFNAAHKIIPKSFFAKRLSVYPAYKMRIFIKHAFKDTKEKTTLRKYYFASINSSVNNCLVYNPHIDASLSIYSIVEYIIRPRNL